MIPFIQSRVCMVKTYILISVNRLLNRIKKIQFNVGFQWLDKEVLLVFLVFRWDSCFSVSNCMSDFCQLWGFQRQIICIHTLHPIFGLQICWKISDHHPTESSFCETAKQLLCSWVYRNSSHHRNLKVWNGNIIEWYKSTAANFFDKVIQKLIILNKKCEEPITIMCKHNTNVHISF